jgi:hypothetical protein
MRNKLVFCMFVGAALMLIAAVAIGASDRRDRYPDAGSYDTKAERMFEGKIVGKGHVLDGLMYFPLKTIDIVVEVQMGTKEFVANSGFKLKPGDMVTVIGVPAVLNEREVVLAREVSGMNGVLLVRDDRGAPMWDTNRPILMDPKPYMDFSEVCQIFTESICNIFHG